MLILNQNGVAERDRRPDPAASGSGSPGCGRARPSRSRPAVRTAVPARTLAVSGLTQRFGGFTALEDVSLSVGPGEVVGLLGPNGAGKTTLIDCVAGNNRLTAGSITWDGAGHHPLGAVPPGPGRACRGRSSRWSCSTT